MLATCWPNQQTVSGWDLRSGTTWALFTKKLGDLSLDLTNRTAVFPANGKWDCNPYRYFRVWSHSNHQHMSELGFWTLKYNPSISISGYLGQDKHWKRESYRFFLGQNLGAVENRVVRTSRLCCHSYRKKVCQIGYASPLKYICCRFWRCFNQSAWNLAYKWSAKANVIGHSSTLRQAQVFAPSKKCGLCSHQAGIATWWNTLNPIEMSVPMRKLVHEWIRENLQLEVMNPLIHWSVFKPIIYRLVVPTANCWSMLQRKIAGRHLGF